MENQNYSPIITLNNLNTVYTDLRDRLNEIGTIHHVKGTCLWSELQSKTANTVGDVWNILDRDKEGSIGSNWQYVTTQPSDSSIWINAADSGYWVRLNSTLEIAKLDTAGVAKVFNTTTTGDTPNSSVTTATTNINRGVKLNNNDRAYITENIANGSQYGLVSTVAQTFSGAKTFTNMATFEDGVLVNGTVDSGSLNTASLLVNGQTLINGDTTSGELDVSGKTTVTGTATINGNLTSGTTGSSPVDEFIVDNTLTVHNNAEISGKTTVTGTTDVTGNATLGNLELKDGSTYKKLTVLADSQTGTLTVTGNTKANGNADLGNLQVDQKLTVNGTATVNGNLTSGTAGSSPTNTFTVTNNLQAKSSAEVTGKLTVSGTATVNGDLTSGSVSLVNGSVYKPLTVTNSAIIDTLSVPNDTLTVNGTATSGTLTVDGNLRSTVNTTAKNVVLKNNENTYYDLTVSGAGSAGSLEVDNKLTAKGTLDANNVDITGDLSVTGNVTAKSDAEITGSLTASGTASIANLTAADLILQNGSTKKNLTVKSNSSVTGSVDVSGTVSATNITAGDVELKDDSNNYKTLTIKSNTTANTLSIPDGTITITGSGATATIGTLTCGSGSNALFSVDSTNKTVSNQKLTVSAGGLEVTKGGLAVKAGGVTVTDANITLNKSTSGTAGKFVGELDKKLTLKVNTGSAEGTSLYTFNNLNDKTLDIKSEYTSSNQYGIQFTTAAGSLTIGHSKSITAYSDTINDTISTAFSIPYLHYDKYGHVSAKKTFTATVQDFKGNDTKDAGASDKQTPQKGLIPAPDSRKFVDDSTAKFFREDGSWTAVSKTNVGLSNVTNEAQIAKSVLAAKGDIIYASAVSTPAKLSIGNQGQFLMAASTGLPAWTSLDLKLIAANANNKTTNTASAAANNSIYLNLINNHPATASVFNSLNLVGSGTTKVSCDANGKVTISTSDSHVGTVTSVGLSLPDIFTVSTTDNPVTTSGTLTATLAKQSKNKIFAGPLSGDPAAPTFRALVSDDIPDLAISKITNLQTALDGKAAVGYYAETSKSNVFSVYQTITSSSEVTSSTDLHNGSGDTESPASGALRLHGGIAAKGGIKGSQVYNAVWNDLSDRIEIDIAPEAGYAYAFDGNHYYKTNRYCDKYYIGIHSDTAGFEMGAKANAKYELNTSVAGFVLAYVDKAYKVGTPLTCTKEGKLTKIGLLQRILHPERVVATFWKTEPNKTWGSDQKKVKVNGRMWVKIK